MAAPTKEHIELFYSIIRKHNYVNTDAIHFKCSSRGIIVSRAKLIRYAARLKREDEKKIHQSILLRQHKIKNVLGKLREKEQALLRELNSINLKLTRNIHTQ